MLEFVGQFAVYGCIGILLEFLFTGFHSAIVDRDPRAVAVSYLWMWPIYSLAGSMLAAIHHTFSGIPFIFVAWIHAYLFEFSAGWILKFVLGRAPWDYGNAKYGIMGLIRLDYWYLWLLVAIGFNFLEPWLSKVFSLIFNM